LSTSRRDTAPRHRDRIDEPLSCIVPPSAVNLQTRIDGRERC
jgi:hypothetical protein